MSLILNRFAISFSNSSYRQRLCTRNRIFSSPKLTFTLWTSTVSAIPLLSFAECIRHSVGGCLQRDLQLWDLRGTFDPSIIDTCISTSLLTLFSSPSQGLSPPIWSSLPVSFQWGGFWWLRLEKHWLELELWLHEEDGDFDAAPWRLLIPTSFWLFDVFRQSPIFALKGGPEPDRFGEANSWKLEYKDPIWKAPDAPSTESITSWSFCNEWPTFFIFREGQRLIPCCRHILFNVVGQTEIGRKWV